METKIFIINANGFCMDGSGMVTIPNCKVKAKSWFEAKCIVDRFLETKELTDDIELITLFEKIKFED